MKSKRNIMLLAIAGFCIAMLVLWVRGTGVGYIESVSGINIPWPRDAEEHYACDVGQYSIITLTDEGLSNVIEENTWRSDSSGFRFENARPFFKSMQAGGILPSSDEFVWLEGASDHNAWVLFLHEASRRLLVVVEHADMSGDLPARALKNQ